MKKSRDHIRRFLSTVRPVAERDEHLIRLFLNKRKIKVAVPECNPNYPNLDTITYEQFEGWYNAGLPTVGDVVRSADGSICLVTDEKWNSFVVGAILSSKNILSFQERRIVDEKWDLASEDDIMALQIALSAKKVEWNSTSNTVQERSLPQQPKSVRLMVLGRQVGIGIFKEVLPDNTVVMFCVKMGNEDIRYSDNLNMGNADCFSFWDTYEEHRALLQEELGDAGLIWNAKCRRIEKNHARAKLGKPYYWVNGYFKIKQSFEKDTYSDQLRFNKGNYFLKRDVAERAKNRMVNICKEEMISDDNTPASR